MDFWFGLQGPALWGVEISTTSFFFLSIIESCVLTFLTLEARKERGILHNGSYCP